METTGLTPETDHIIEIACVKVRNGIVMAELEYLVRCNIPIPDFISKLTGISENELTEKGISLEEAVSETFKFIGNDCIIGHNVAFDILFLQNASGKLSMNCPEIKAIDTYLLVLAKEKLKDAVSNFRLESLARYYQIADKQAHRALTDARITAQLYIKLKEN